MPRHPPARSRTLELHGPYLHDEVRHGWELYKTGFTRDIYFRQDRPGVAIIAEADSVEAARVRLMGFPLAKAGLIGWDVIPLGPMLNWSCCSPRRTDTHFKITRLMMIQDKVVIVTGASSGIGEASARLLASRGARLVLGARREDKLKRLAEEIRASGGQAVYDVMDVAKAVDNEAIVHLAKQSFGRVDAIFLNAGLMPNSPLSALKTDEWQAMVDVNITGVLNGVAAVLPSFIAQKSGHVIATSSVAGLKAYPGCAVYGGTKWFVRNFMEVRAGVGHGGHQHPHGDDLSGRHQHRVAGHDQRPEHCQCYEGLTRPMAFPPDSGGQVVAFALDLPEHTTVNEFTVGPANQPW